MAKIIFIIIIAVLIPSLAFSQNNGYGHMDDGWHMMHYGYGSLIMWLLLIVVIVLLVFLATQLQKGRRNEKRTHETALDILKKRYAKGELNKEEFERMKQDMKD